ncbi:hypothetical protein IGI37_003167 [Enterococcus sp. AZ194]|uniref:hypothetical protein n=1 Tax=Enterococcus sp. AZ194 TaxID=2774629 RepID=UPI003F216AF2
MKKIKRDTVILLSTFWCVGLGHIFFQSFHQIEQMFSTEWILVSLIGILLLLFVALSVLLTYLIKGWIEFKETKQANFWLFLWTDSSIIEEDERSIKISEHALKKSNEYTEGFIAALILILIVSGAHSVSANQIIFAVLLAFSIKTLSYYFLSKKGYYS